MRQFRIKNIVVQLLPAENEVASLGEIADCPGASACSLNITSYTQDCCDVGCSKQPSGVCLPCTNITDVHLQANGPLDFLLLKQQLRQALKNVEDAEQLTEARMRPTTAEEVASLEGYLTEALGGLRDLSGDATGSDASSGHDTPER